MLKCVESFFPFFCAEDVFVSTYLVSISSSAIYFMIGERRKRRKNTMGKTSVQRIWFWIALLFGSCRQAGHQKNPLLRIESMLRIAEDKKFHTQRKKRTNSEKNNKHSPFFHMLDCCYRQTWATNSNQLPTLLHYYRCTHELHCASRAKDHSIGLDLILN